MIGKFLKGRVEKPAQSGGTDSQLIERVTALVAEYEKEMEVFGFYKALNSIFEITGMLNKYIDTEAPWKLAKENPERIPTVLYNVWNGVRVATLLLSPFMPTKTAQVWKALGLGGDIGKVAFDDEKQFYHAGDLAEIGKIPPLFPRIGT